MKPIIFALLLMTTGVCLGQTLNEDINIEKNRYSINSEITVVEDSEKQIDRFDHN